MDTRTLTARTIHVNPLPLLRREKAGRDIFRGLIAHELGHQKYHSDPPSVAVWNMARRQGLADLLNLVADEHLERNLSALSLRFATYFHRLAAYAFQHSCREIAVEALLGLVRENALQVLTRCRLRPGRMPGTVLIANGQLLAAAERSGLSFSRFVRRLRMGLGNRSGDPKVAESLKLFGPDFRHGTTASLLEVAAELKRIFGAEVEILGMVGQDRMFPAEQRNLLVHGDGITDADVEHACRQGQGVRKRSPLTSGPLPGRGGQAPAAPDQERFNRITHVRHMEYSEPAAAALARQVARQARALRRYLKELGLSLQADRRRLRGHRVDRGRLTNLLLWRDYRVLVARRLRRTTDLFLGVVIDCSGSMAGASLEKAKRFGALLAEAVRGMAGVDLRLFGFTDKVIYDVGDAARPAIHGLTGAGGNNDAAALWHTAQCAIASRRKAKLLVMISDGAQRSAAFWRCGPW